MSAACYTCFPNCNAMESAFFLMFGRDPVNKLNHVLHQARRYFHDENGLPDLEALKNIYQVVAQQLLSSRERYMKKHHNQNPVESAVKPGNLILTVNHTVKAFKQERNPGSESKWQPSAHRGFQRKHLHSTHHTYEEDNTDR